MKYILLLLVVGLFFIVFGGCKNTNNNKARGSGDGLSGTWTTEVATWNGSGENTLSFTRKAESTGSKSIAFAEVAESTPAQTAEEKKAAEDKKKKEEEEKKKNEEAAKKEESKTKIVMSLKVDIKKKEISGTITITGKNTSEGSFSGKSNSLSEFKDFKSKIGNKEATISAKLTDKNNLSGVIKFSN